MKWSKYKWLEACNKIMIIKWKHEVRLLKLMYSYEY